MSSTGVTIATVTPECTYRLLPREEWDRLVPIFEANNGILPSPELATVAVAERGGEIVGLLVLQLIPHFEPAWADDPKVNFRHLTKLLEAHVPRGATVYTSAPNAHIAGLAVACGFQPTGWIVMSKTVSSEVQ